MSYSRTPTPCSSTFIFTDLFLLILQWGAHGEATSA